VLVLDIADMLFDEYEWVEDIKTYREALIPAEDLNRYLDSVRVLCDDEDGSLGGESWSPSRPTSGPRALSTSARPRRSCRRSTRPCATWTPGRRHRLT
jgi:hypothetical protein